MASEEIGGGGGGDGWGSNGFGGVECVGGLSSVTGHIPHSLWHLTNCTITRLHLTAPLGSWS